MTKEDKIEIDSKLAEIAEMELNKIGLTLEQYVDLAARQLLIQQKVPFEIELESGIEINR